jgi:hypothetical protein
MDALTIYNRNYHFLDHEDLDMLGQIVVNDLTQEVEIQSLPVDLPAGGQWAW